MPIAYVIKKGDRFTSNLTYFTVAAYIHLFSGTTSSSIYIHHTKNLILSTTLSNIKCVYHIHRNPSSAEM